MGVVYRAEHLNLQRRAAMKIIAPDLAEYQGLPRALHRARRGSPPRSSTRTSSRSTTRARSTACCTWRCSTSPGTDLAADPARRGPARPYRAIDVCRQVASALDAAHGMALIHRDVKPGNVLIEGRRAYLTDFGLTKRLGRHASPSSPTPARWSGRSTTSRPSRSRAREVDARTRRLLARLPALPLPDRARCRSSATPTWRSSTRTCRETPPKLTERAAGAARGPRRRDRQGAGQAPGPALPHLRGPDVRGARGRSTPPGRSRDTVAARGVPRAATRRTPRPRSSASRGRSTTAASRAAAARACCWPASTPTTRAVARVALGERCRGAGGARRRTTCWSAPASARPDLSCSLGAPTSSRDAVAR